MSCLTSFFNRAAVLAVLLVAASCSGCGRFTAENFTRLSELVRSAERVETVELPWQTTEEDRAVIMVLPIDNLSDTRAPLREIEGIIRARLLWNGFRLVEKERLEQFRKKHRMRYTGGVGSRISKAIQEETGADAILITSLEAYDDGDPPRVSLISRLVTSGSRPEILWIDSVGLAGDESPGLLGLTLIRDSERLVKKAVRQLIGGMTDTFKARNMQAAGVDETSGSASGWDRKYLPYDFFRSPAIDPDMDYSIAVIPMLNLSIRKNAGNIVSLHYVRELFHRTGYTIMEPGVVREELLRFRAIMPAGPSLAVTDLITSPGSLGVDLVLSGRVFSYQDTTVGPKADFSVQVIEKESRKIVFGARTFTTGNEGVWFFDFGRVYTAHDLVEGMTRTTTRLLSARSLPQEAPQQEFIASAPAKKLLEQGYAGAVLQAREIRADHPYVVVLATGLKSLHDF